jgi:alkylation response protein AidB-like acyl-CoA dehydrogenase
VSTDTGRAAVAERVESFVNDVVAPIAPAMARGEGPHPKRVIEAAGGAGLAGMLTPVEYGGAGGTHADFIELIEAIARADASTAVIVDVHLSVGTEPIIVFGNDDQKSRYLPRLASGEWLAAFALTEPGGGSDAAAVRTRAVLDGDAYVLDGSKAFITGAGDADLYIVMARTGSGTHGVSAFLVESAWPGVTAGRPLEKMGLHGSWTAELVFDGVRVPVANRLGDEGIGFTVAMSALDSGRVGISAQAVGISQGSLDAAIACSRTRGNAGAPVDAVALADMEVRTAASRQLTRHAAALVDAGQRVTLPASIAKLYSTDACVAVAETAVDLCAPDSAADGHLFDD